MVEVNTNTIRTRQCATAFQHMIWAFIFFVDVRLGINNVHLDVLPDVIGWAIIASALTTILELSPIIRILRTLAYWLLFLSLFDVVEFRITVVQADNVTLWISPTFFVSIISTILDSILIWKLCGLIMAIATAMNNPKIRRRASFRRKLYLALVVLLRLSVLISFVFLPFTIITVIVGFPIGIIVLCLMMELMKDTADIAILDQL